MQLPVISMKIAIQKTTILIKDILYDLIDPEVVQLNY